MKKLIGFGVILIGFMVTFLSTLAFFLEDYFYSFQGTPIWPILLGIGVMLSGLFVLRANMEPASPRRKTARTEVDDSAKNESRLSTHQVAASLFDLAVRLEHATAGFYLQASKQTIDPEAAKALRKLASKELEHEEHFSELKLKYLQMTEAPVKEATKHFILRYVEAVRDSRVFDFDYHLSEVLSGKEKTEDVIRLAIGLEKDGIVFYSGLQNFIDNHDLKALLETIIREEFEHLSDLTEIDFA